MNHLRQRTLGPALRAMAVGRILLGAGSLVAPGALARTFGARDSTEFRYLTRVYGARATAMGLAYLLGGPSERRRLQRLFLGVDVSDTVAGLAHLARGDQPTRGIAMCVAITGPYAALGAARTLADLSRPGAEPGHHMAEEDPVAVADALAGFLG